VDINWRKIGKLSRKYNWPKQKYRKRFRGGGFFFDSQTHTVYLQ